MDLYAHEIYCLGLNFLYCIRTWRLALVSYLKKGPAKLWDICSWQNMIELEELAINQSLNLYYLNEQEWSGQHVLSQKAVFLVFTLRGGLMQQWNLTESFQEQCSLVRIARLVYYGWLAGLWYCVCNQLGYRLLVLSVHCVTKRCHYVLIKWFWHINTYYRQDFLVSLSCRSTLPLKADLCFVKKWATQKQHGLWRRKTSLMSKNAKHIHYHGTNNKSTIQQ